MTNEQLKQELIKFREYEVNDIDPMREDIIDDYLSQRKEPEQSKQEQVNRICYTCKHEDILSYQEPCRLCNPRTFSNWQPKEKEDEE